MGSSSATACTPVEPASCRSVDQTLDAPEALNRTHRQCNCCSHCCAPDHACGSGCRLGYCHNYCHKHCGSGFHCYCYCTTPPPTPPPTRPPTQPPTSAPTTSFPTRDGQALVVTIGVQYCQANANNCISDADGDHGNNERCVFHVRTVGIRGTGGPRGRSHIQRDRRISRDP